MSEKECPCCGLEFTFTEGEFFTCHACLFRASVCYLPRIAAAIDFYDADNRLGGNVTFDDYAALLARHNALREAVAWERECGQDIRPLFAWSGLYLRHGEGYLDGVAEDLRAIQDAARAEVDRLIAGEGAADCKGEGC